ncbi:MAG: GIY-YIG nuclease family protein [bacterium]
MYYTYILRSLKTGRLYKGWTHNLEMRLKTHETLPCHTDKTDGPFELVWYCAFKDKFKALAFEKYLKSGSGRAFTNKRLV